MLIDKRHAAQIEIYLNHRDKCMRKSVMLVKQVLFRSNSPDRQTNGQKDGQTDGIPDLVPAETRMLQVNQQLKI